MVTLLVHVLEHIIQQKFVYKLDQSFISVIQYFLNPYNHFTANCSYIWKMDGEMFQILSKEIV